MSETPEILARRPAALESDDAWLEPFGWYREMRAESPVRYDPEREVWDVFRHDDVTQVIKDYQTFSSAFGERFRERAAAEASKGTADAATDPVHGPAAGEPVTPVPEVADTMLTADPPEHERLRSVVAEHFRAAAIRGYEPRVEEIAARRVAEMETGETDLVGAFSYPFPVDVIAALLGVPSEDRATFKRWSDTVVQRPDEGPADGARREREAETVEEMNDYFRELLAERRADPKDDLLSAIAAAGEGEPGLTEEEALAFCILLLVAGNVTTTNLLTNAIWCFEEHGVTDAVRSGDIGLEGAIEEVLRLRSPVQALFRIAREDVTVGGERIEKGDAVVAWLGSANRDERAFPNPDAFDATRRPTHVAFGNGIHYCLGAPLARLEARVGLRALLERFERIDADIDAPEASPSALYGLARLPVTLG